MIILSLGSNLSSSFGNRFININLALELLSKQKIIIKKKSSFYETPSYPDKSKPKFINVVVQAEAQISPEDIASIIISVEESLERKRGSKNDPRTCDIDIIDYNNQLLDFRYKKLEFTVPHKMLIFRNFVLYPLKEILPTWRHPRFKDSITKMINNLKEDDKKSILKINKT